MKKILILVILLCVWYVNCSQQNNQDSKQLKEKTSSLSLDPVMQSMRKWYTPGNDKELDKANLLEVLAIKNTLNEVNSLLHSQRLDVIRKRSYIWHTAGL
jgi:hypothetical protein